MDPETQPEIFTDQARSAIPSDFLTSSDISSQNVFSTYSSNMGVYGQGNMPETKEASSKVTENSQRAGKEASPQRAVDGVNSVDGKGAFKGKEITPIHFTFRGDSWEHNVTFRDTFSCFKSALECFVQEVVIKRTMPIPRAETQEILHVLIQGTIR
jgi:hypothetical protein